MADKPVTREEKYLAYLMSDYTGEIPKPITRKEKYLYELCLKGMGGEISPEEIKNAVNEYIENNPVKPGATTEQAQQIEQNKKDVASLKTETSSLKEDISNKITKFYASNQGETHITDSDNGKIQDMMLYGKSLQDGTPSPENPVEIKSVVNPSVKVCGKNLFDISSVIKNNMILNSGIGFHNESWNSTNFIECNNDVYTLSEKNKGYYFQYRFAFYDFNKKFLSIINIERGDIYEIKITKPKDARYLRFCYSKKVGGKDVDREKIQLEIGETATLYEPYKPIQKATLPYTLNAIPVSSGGNVTIDGQEYVADYVDVERGKLVRMTELIEYDGTENWSLQSINNNGIANFQIGIKRYIDSIGMCDAFQLQKTLISNTNTEGFMINNDNSLFIRINTARGISTLETFKEFLANKHIFVLYALPTPTEIDIAKEEITAFKALATYYPTTNISVNSEQLDGYTVFNYPISMQNGWNYVKQQLNDNRDYIYDMDLQSAEAYVNSEYAVALTELEV